jgi:hypothetical protein
MKSPLDDARLRLSAVHVEMSAMEQERAATKIAEGMTGKQIGEHCLEIERQLDRLVREQQTLWLQLDLLHRAYQFQLWRKAK